MYRCARFPTPLTLQGHGIASYAQLLAYVRRCRREGLLHSMPYDRREEALVLAKATGNLVRALLATVATCGMLSSRRRGRRRCFGAGRAGELLHRQKVTGIL